MNIHGLRLFRMAASAAVIIATTMTAGMNPTSSLAQNSGMAASQPAPSPQATPQTTPPWAFPVSPTAPPPKDDGTLKHVPGSDAAFTVSQVRDAFNVADWHPGDHTSMPEVVSHGRKPDVRACGYCHLPNGQGRPENSSIAGLPAAYIVQQVADFKSGARKSSEPNMGPPNSMIGVAKAASDAETMAAAEYFAHLKLKPWIRVVETRTVPKTKVSGSMLVAIEGGGQEPIGERIIETPENLERTELRDSGSGFIAYVPPGSVKKGEALVTKGGGGRTIRCGICHGADLKGLANVPSLAGRSPSYIIRQLYDLQKGSRTGPWTPLMKEVVSKLTLSDMVSIAAYTASLKP